MTSTGRWVLLAYRVPREPSTPRIAIWRKLKRLGVAQLLDGLVGLPLDERNREQLEWLAEEIEQAGGEASVWLADPTTAAQQRALTARLDEAVGRDYDAVAAEAHAAAAGQASAGTRTLARLRRELDRIRRRDYFGAGQRAEAERAVEALRVMVSEAAA